MLRTSLLMLTLALTAALSACDALGIESPATALAKREADGKAVGAACRHAGRAIEDCYTLNKKADKAGVFAGWREMNDYMRENKIDPVAPLLPAVTKPMAAADDDAQDAGDDHNGHGKPGPKKKKGS